MKSLGSCLMRFTTCAIRSVVLYGKKPSFFCLGKCIMYSYQPLFQTLCSSPSGFPKSTPSHAMLCTPIFVPHHCNITYFLRAATAFTLWWTKRVCFVKTISSELWVPWRRLVAMIQRVPTQARVERASRRKEAPTLRVLPTFTRL